MADARHRDRQRSPGRRKKPVGRLIETLFEGRPPPGSTRFVYRADGVASGVYFIRATPPTGSAQVPALRLR